MGIGFCLESEPIALRAPGEYEEALLNGFVIADVEVRRQRIRKALDKVTRTVEGAAVAGRSWAGG